MPNAAIPVTGDPEADLLLERDPLALLIGMLLDQQVPMEWAFAGPHRLKQRLGGLEAAVIAAAAPEQIEAAFKEKPALHRFPGAMARRTQELCRHLVENYDGQPERIWKEASSGGEVLKRLKAMPGYGDEKSKIFVALLAKRLGIRPAGWEEAAAPFSDARHRSVADIDSPESLEEVRRFKRAMKAQSKGKGD